MTVQWEMFQYIVTKEYILCIQCYGDIQKLRFHGAKKVIGASESIH